MSALANVPAPGVLPRLLADDFGPLVVPRDLISIVRAAGLRGRGGSGFETAEKLEAAAAHSGRPIVVANAAEGEPASSKDRALLRVAPHLVLDGVIATAAALHARQAVVAIADTAVDERRSLERALAQRRERLGIDIATVPHRFVAGEETALLNAIEGRAAKPSLKPPYPFERGYHVQNAETLAHIALIARYGAAWFRAAGTPDAPGTALVTLRGAVNKPGVHEIELGGTLGDLLLRLGGANGPVSAFLVGGYFGKWIAARDAATFRLTPETLGAGALVALPEGACAVGEVARVTRYLAGESAGQCGPCVYGLDAIATALEEHAQGRDRLPQLRRWTQMVQGRGACKHPDGAARFVESALDVFADEFARHAGKGRCGRRSKAVLPA